MVPKLSLAYNAYTINADVEQMTLRSIRSFLPYVDEIVFSEDGGIESPEIRSLCHQYIWHENAGSCRCTNISWEAARGDFVINAQTDTEYVSGNLHDLCIADKITNPQVVGVDGKPIVSDFNGDQHSEFFCVPRALKDQYGMLDERLHNYFQDYLYFNAVLPVHQVVESVVIQHVGHGTIGRMSKDRGIEENKTMQADFWKYIEITQKKYLEENDGVPLIYGQSSLVDMMLAFSDDLKNKGREDAHLAVHELIGRVWGVCPVSKRLKPSRMVIEIRIDEEKERQS